MKVLAYIFVISNFFALNFSFGQCFLATIWNGMEIKNSTGNTELDKILHNQEVDLETFFGVNINLSFGIEQSRSGNAFFSPFCSSLYCNGQIVLGTYLMTELSQKKDSYIRLVAVFAHEFAHAMQHKYGWSGNSKWRELHADYLAGFYLGKNSSLNQSEVISTFNEFSSRGSFDFNNPDFHGTPEERGCAFLEGFKYGRLGTTNVYNAYNSGKNYITANNPCNKYKPQRATPLDLLYLAGAAPEAAILIGGLAIVGSVILFSNDIYIRPTLNFGFFNKQNQIKYKGGFGWSYGLRKQFNRSALEYGVNIIRHKVEYPSYTDVKQFTYFNMNYLHNINLKFVPSRLQSYGGLGLNLGGNGIGVSGIIGAYLPLIDRFSLDFRYELGNKTNQIHFGLIFKYQKEYLWNKRKQR